MIQVDLFLDLNLLLCALINGPITFLGETLLNRIPTKVPYQHVQPAANAEIQRPTGTNENSINNTQLLLQL